MTQLFRSYSLLFLALFLVSVVVFGSFMISSVHSSIIETQQHITQTTTQAINDYFNNMNAFSLLLMNSDEFKEAVIDELPQSRWSMNITVVSAHQFFYVLIPIHISDVLQTDQKAITALRQLLRLRGASARIMRLPARRLCWRSISINHPFPLT